MSFTATEVRQESEDAACWVTHEPPSVQLALFTVQAYLPEDGWYFLQGAGPSDIS